jgi:hypothetical protein
MKKANDFRLDWQQEFSRLKPFMLDRGGVILLQYANEHAAPLKFNHLLKEDLRPIAHYA